MTKLDEIEARIDNTLFGQVGGREKPYFRGEHAKLLIKAVRQLQGGRSYKHGYVTETGWSPYDPDVLELIKSL